MKGKKIIISIMLVAALFLLMVGCGAKNENVDSVTLNVTEKELKVGENFALTATVKLVDESLTDTDLSVTWTSSKLSVASIDDSGKITAKSAGVTTVTAKSKANKDKTASCEVTVVDPNAAIKNAGEYKVGTDIPAGEYLLITNTQDNSVLSMGYLEVTKKPNASIGSSDFLYNDNFFYRTYISVNNGEYVRFSNSKLYHTTSFEVDKNAISWTSGQYKVGVDLDAGSYILTTWASDSIADMGYVEITTTPYAKIGTPQFLSNDNFESQKYIVLKEGQYITIKKAILSKDAN